MCSHQIRLQFQFNPIENERDNSNKAILMVLFAELDNGHRQLHAVQNEKSTASNLIPSLRVEIVIDRFQINLIQFIFYCAESATLPFDI